MSADIVFHNSSSQETNIWFMDKNRIQDRETVTLDGKSILAGLPWNIVGLGHFGPSSGGGILWHNSSSHETQIWVMDKNQVIDRNPIVAEDNTPVPVQPPWSIVGVGNFGDRPFSPNGDDILFHSSDGGTQIWFMNDAQIGRRASLVQEDGKTLALVQPPWSIVGVADFDKDGIADILFHSSDGGTQIWFMDGNRIKGRAPLVQEDGKTLALVQPPWSIVGVADFDNSGGADILFRSSDGGTQIWFMDGNRIKGRAPLVAEDGKTPMTVGPPWSIVGANRFLPTPPVPPH
jgi:hypothetical protein